MYNYFYLNMDLSTNFRLSAKEKIENNRINGPAASCFFFFLSYFMFPG